MPGSEIKFTIIRNLFFILIFVSFLFSGCDRFYSVEAGIYNYSNDTLVLKATLSDSVITRYLAPGESADFAKGYHHSRLYCCPCEFSFIELSPKDPTKKINKEFTTKENWYLYTPKKREKKIWTCMFVVNFNDIQ